MVAKDVVATLVVQRATGTSNSIELTGGQSLRIGRVSGNDLVLEDGKVSRFHAVVNTTSSGLVISDLSSLNGTLVNGRRVTVPTEVPNGSTISIGDIAILVKLHREVQITDDSFAQQTQAASLRNVVVTILVADVCGYTRISESVPPFDVAMMLQRWFELVGDTVRTHGGEVDKYLGDAVMAIWYSAPDKAAECAKRATQAAQVVVTETAKHAEASGWKHGEQYPWTCRVCLNTGEALQGTFGASMTRDYTVLGDSINTAFRLETIAKGMQEPFVVTGQTAKLIADEFEVRDLGMAAAKGKTEQISVFAVVAPNENP